MPKLNTAKLKNIYWHKVFLFSIPVDQISGKRSLVSAAFMEQVEGCCLLNSISSWENKTGKCQGQYQYLLRSSVPFRRWEQNSFQYVNWVVCKGLGPGLHWAMYIKQVSKSPSLNFTWTNSFGPDMPTAKIIKDISLLKQNKSGWTSTSAQPKELMSW